jgi:hypothetical protein
LKIANQSWQSYFCCWQNHLIHQNLFQIGHTAWQGYLEAGAGVVVCDVTETISPEMDWKTDSVAFNLTYVPAKDVTAYCQTIALPTKAITVLESAIAAYDPTLEIILLLTGNGKLDVNRLQNLRVSPVACYEQVQRRWTEFQPQGTH